MESAINDRFSLLGTILPGGGLIVQCTVGPSYFTRSSLDNLLMVSDLTDNITFNRD